MTAGWSRLLCFGCGRLEERLDLAILGSPDGLDDWLNHQTIAESRFFAKINLLHPYQTRPKCSPDEGS
jgi:hypothetical protein